MKTVLLSVLLVLFTMAAFCQSDTSAVLVGTATPGAPDATITSQTWTQLSGSPATMTTQRPGTVIASKLTAGVYVFAFSATDNFGNISVPKQLKVTILRYNPLPITNVGGDIIIQLGKSN